jgi:hypothetical protein
MGANGGKDFVEVLGAVKRRRRALLCLGGV